MTTFAVSFYDVVLWLHITAVVVGFGGTFAYGIIIATAAKQDPRAIPAVLAGVTQNSKTLVTGGGVLVLLTGIYLAADAWSMGDFFVSWGFVAVLVLIGMTHTVFRQNEELAAKSAPGTPEHERAMGNLSRFGPIAGIIIVVTIYVMSAKPFL